VYQPEKPRDPPKPEQITLKDLVLADIVLPDQSGKGGIQGVITNNSTLSLERVTFEVTLKDGNQLISTTTTEICSFNWYVKHSGCWESCAGATLPVPPHQVRQLRTCALRFGQISQLKNPRIGYRVTQLNENDMQTETLFAQSPAEQPSPRSLPTPTVSAASPKVETTDEKLAKEVPVVAASPADNSNQEPGYNAHTDCYPDGCARVEAFQKEATRLVTTLITNQEIGAEMRSAHYADTVNYYGSVKSRGAVTVDIQQFINRWPRRTYRITSINTTCTTRPARNYCVVAGEVAYQAEAPNRRSVGTATFEFTVINDDGTLLVSTENGRTLTRQVSAK
jgi:hypothetical protein